MKKYICNICGQSTKDVDYDYLVGFNHLDCMLKYMRGPLKEIVNWDKLKGYMFKVNGSYLEITDTARITDTLYAAEIKGFFHTVRLEFDVNEMTMILHYWNGYQKETRKIIAKNEMQSPKDFLKEVTDMMEAEPDLLATLI